MTTVLAPIPAELLPDLRQLADEGEQMEAAAQAPATRRAYNDWWRQFETFCRANGLCPFPADASAVYLYLQSLAKRGLKPSSIAVAKAAIADRHRDAGANPCKHPKVERLMAGIRRQRAAPPDRKQAVCAAELVAMLDAVPRDTLAGRRDRALLLVGWFSAMRRSELSAMDVAHLTVSEKGIRVTIPRSKTDKACEGQFIALPLQADADLCPVRTLRAWLDAAGIESGPLWRAVDKWGVLRGNRLSGESIAGVVKRSAKRVGIDPSRVAGHSLRSGLITTAVLQGIPIAEIAQQSRHASVDVLVRYVRPATVFDANAACKVRLKGN